MGLTKAEVANPLDPKRRKTLTFLVDLEYLGLIFNPIRQELLSLPLVIADARKYFR